MKGTGIGSSRRVAPSPLFGAAASFLLHGAVVGGYLALTAHIASLPPGEAPAESAQFLYPLLRPMPHPVREQVAYIGLPGPPTAPLVQNQSSKGNMIAAAPPPPTQAAIEEVRIEEPPRAFSEIEVDSAVVRDPSSVGPTFPRQLLQAKIEGVTRVQFIVDSTGHVEVTSLVILDSTHPEFTQAVRDVLPKMKFKPARIGTRAVAQMVEQGFAFRINPP
ncbi:MAG: TonB family protein [Gemmatimonadaceae bacterium]